MESKTNYIQAILVILLLVSFYRIVTFVDFTSVASLQMDFTAYYTTGKVFLTGADIYKNQIVNDWLLWDGVAVFNHSRFLYPPLTAMIFSVFSLLEYSSAKYLWNILNFLFVTSALLLLMKAFIKKLNFDLLVIALLVLLNFFPFITMLERGQVDGLNLLLITTAIILTKRKDSFPAGVVLAIATLFKLYVVLLIPFMLIAKKPRAVWGYVSGVIVLSLLSFLLTGYERNVQYVFEEMPRLSQLGESGFEEMKIPSESLRNYFQLSKYSVSMVEGKMYRTEIISFNSKASFLRIFSVLNEKTHLNLPLAVVSLILYLVFLGFVILLIRKKSLHDEKDYLMFWIMSLVVILLCSNFTWVMNLVWLIPLIVFLIMNVGEVRISLNPYYVLLLLGFLLAAMPDDLLLVKGVPVVEDFFKVKYILSLVLIFAGCVVKWRGKKTNLAT